MLCAVKNPHFLFPIRINPRSPHGKIACSQLDLRASMLANRLLDPTAILPTSSLQALRKHGAPPAFLSLLLLLLLTAQALHQNRPLQQPAKLLLRHLLMLPPPTQRIRHRLILHLQPPQLHNPVILASLMPNLILLKFHIPVIRTAPPMRQPFLKETAFGFWCNYRSSSLPVSFMMKAMTMDVRDEAAIKAAVN
jgi:hypothetical protein